MCTQTDAQIRDIIAIVSSLTALFAVFMGGRIQLRLARSSYLRDSKEKWILQLEENLSGILAIYNYIIMVTATPQEQRSKMDMALLDEYLPKANILLIKLTLQLRGSDPKHSMLLKLLAETSQSMFEEQANITTKLTIAIVSMRKLAQEIINDERELLSKL